MKTLITCILILIPLALAGFLVWKDIDPDGSFEIRHQLADRSPYIDRFLPDERVEVSEDGVVTVAEEPIYIALHLPRTNYETVEVTLEFQPGDQPVIELGAIKDIFSQTVDLKPIYHAFLESLDWNRMEDDGVTLYQKTKQFTSVEDFLNNLPDRSRIASYRYDLETPFRLPNYTPLNSERNFDVSLRGYHRFVTYIKNESFYLELRAMDMNRTAGRDDLSIVVRNEQKEVVYEQEWKDDGNIDENQLSTTRTIQISQSGLPEGVYTVELITTSDVFWRSIKTNLRYVTFINQLYIGDDVGHKAEARSTTFFTNVKYLSTETFHTESPKQMTVAGQLITIPTTHEIIRTPLAYEGIGESIVSAGGIRLIGEGKFALSADSFFDPDPIKIPASDHVDSSGIDFIITSYKSPTQAGEWLTQTVEFTVEQMRNQENDATLLLSTPLVADRAQLPMVNALHLRFKKTPLTTKEVISELRERLPFGL